MAINNNVINKLTIYQTLELCLVCSCNIQTTKNTLFLIENEEEEEEEEEKKNYIFLSGIQ